MECLPPGAKYSLSVFVHGKPQKHTCPLESSRVRNVTGFGYVYVLIQNLFEAGQRFNTHHIHDVCSDCISNKIKDCTEGVASFTISILATVGHKDVVIVDTAHCLNTYDALRAFFSSHILGKNMPNGAFEVRVSIQEEE